MVRIAVVLLVDDEGRVLLMERDEHAPRAPEKWGMIGGHVEEGEDFDTAISRELAEETGLRMAVPELRLWHAGTFRYSDAPEPFDYRVYAARTSATGADIVVGEGRQIVFVEPSRILTLDMAESCAHFVPEFLASPLYAELRSLRGPGATGGGD
ncbi:MAG: NUDIX domain-containing protein [Marmoricola sp.]